MAHRRERRSRPRKLEDVHPKHGAARNQKTSEREAATPDATSKASTSFYGARHGE